jgi:hypothetical protein
MLDALDLTGGERSAALAFSARFIEAHPTLVHEAEWALRVVGSSEGFTDEVWAPAPTIFGAVCTFSPCASWRGGGSAIRSRTRQLLAAAPSDCAKADRDGPVPELRWRQRWG